MSAKVCDSNRTHTQALRFRLAHVAHSCTDRYAGTQTFTVFLTNCMLLSLIIFNSLSRTWEGVKGRAAISMFVFEPQVSNEESDVPLISICSARLIISFYFFWLLQRFNAIDPDYVDPQDRTMGGRLHVTDITSNKRDLGDKVK